MSHRADWGTQELDAHHHDQPTTDVLAIDAWPVEQAPHDAQWVQRVQRGHHAAGWLAASLQRPMDDADRITHAKTIITGGLDYDTARAYLERPLPAADDGSIYAALTSRKALPAPSSGQDWVEKTASCPHGCGRYVRLDRHLARKHKTAAGAET